MLFDYSLWFLYVVSGVVTYEHCIERNKALQAAAMQMSFCYCKRCCSCSLLLVIVYWLYIMDRSIMQNKMPSWCVYLALLLVPPVADGRSLAEDGRLKGC